MLFNNLGTAGYYLREYDIKQVYSITYDVN